MTLNEIFSQFQQAKIIDLTHSLSSRIPSWSGSTAFSLKDEDQISMLTSAGTHIDVPALFFEQGATVDQLPLRQLFGPASVLDVSKKAKADYQIQPHDIEEYEAKYGPIVENSIVVGYTGWSRHWSNPTAYRNVDSKGHACFPTFSFSAVELLVNRRVAGVAIDTLALESLDSSFPAHKLLLGAGKYIIENIANVSELPHSGAYIFVLPLKIEKGAEAPARVLGFITR